MSHVYAEDPLSTAHQALTEGLDNLARAMDLMVVHTVHGDSPKRTRNRPHTNESPGRHMPPTGNVKPVGGRVVVPGRPAMPAQPGPGQRGSDSATVAGPGETTVGWSSAPRRVSRRPSG